MPELPTVTLTPEQQLQAEQYREHEVKHAVIMQRFKDDMDALGKTLTRCTNHVWTLPERAKWEWFGEWVIEDTVVCAICNHHGNWFCPDSPTKACEYSTDEDSCDYCGQPDERK